MNKEITRAAIFSIAHGELELEGPIERIDAFNIAKETIEEYIFPCSMSYGKLISLAVDLGLKVRKVK